VAAFVNDGGNVWIASDSGGDAVGALRSGRCDDGALFVSRVAVSPALIKTRLKRMQYRPASSTASSPAPGSTSCPSVTPTIKDL